MNLLSYKYSNFAERVEKTQEESRRLNGAVKCIPIVQ
jgi:hypothetical protein